MTVLSIVSDLASFGAAGLMGTMWLWERRLNRLREQQLTDAHSNHEMISIEDIERASSVLRSFVVAWCGQPAQTPLESAHPAHHGHDA